MTDWTESRTELLAAAEMLVSADLLVDVGQPGDTILDFLEKPWKWAAVREMWISAGRPDPDDSRWELLAARLDRIS